MNFRIQFIGLGGALDKQSFLHRRARVSKLFQVGTYVTR